MKNDAGLPLRLSGFVMNIPSPYLVYLGAATDPLSIKTSRGVAEWRRELCVGQRRLPGCEVTLGLEDLTYKEAVARGAKTLILGEANAGGLLSELSAAKPSLPWKRDSMLHPACISGFHNVRIFAQRRNAPAVRCSTCANRRPTCRLATVAVAPDDGC